MTGLRSPARTIVYAGVAALAWFPAAAVLVPAWGGRRALLVFAALAVSAHVAGLARSLPAAFRTGAACAAVTLLAAWLAPSLAVGLALLAVALSVVRSGLLDRARPARAVATEVVLSGGGLLAAGWIADGTPTGVALGTWTFFLIQGAYFLVQGSSPRPGSDRVDPFDAACTRAVRAMEDAA